ncbi:unnamed protein product [Larinioides sclopetarius]|uniref:Uncharacterized protein n=1 Tax=Larinioides sclopetarius TaxID=280406 RepID=A0AAV2ANN0_9ARAC
MSKSPRVCVKLVRGDYTCCCYLEYPSTRSLHMIHRLLDCLCPLYA